MTWDSLKIPLYSYPENDKDLTEKMYSIIHKMYTLLLSTNCVQNVLHCNQYVASYTASAPRNVCKSLGEVFIIFSA
jgi:hypothetical protein